jgi:nitronate monooxygenase
MWKKLYHDVPDAVVVEGPEAGGHLGFKESDLENESSALETVVPEVVDLLKPYEEEFDRAVPVIAAGGVFTGEDIHRMMQLGAAGVQMGTRFAATDECDADIRFKEAVVSCAKEDIGIIKSPVGMPGRAVVNNFLRAAEVKKRRFTCPWQCLAGCRADEAYYCISLALNNARKGNLDRGFVFIGSNGYRVENISSVAELIKELREQYISSLIADIQQSITDKVHAFCREFRNELPVPVFQELRLTD